MRKGNHFLKPTKFLQSWTSGNHIGMNERDEANIVLSSTDIRCTIDDGIGKDGRSIESEVTVFCYCDHVCEPFLPHSKC